MAITFTLDRAGVDALTRRGGEIDRNMEQRARRVLAAAVGQAPVKTGRMRASGEVIPFGPIPAAWDVTFPVGYSVYVDRGTRYMRGRPFLSGNVDQAL